MNGPRGDRPRGGAPPARGARRSLLRERDFALLVAAVGVSAVGDWIAWVALTLLVRAMTDSGMAVAGVVLCLFAPIVVLSPWAGLLVDRTETVRLAAVMSAVMAALATLLAVSDGLAAILVLTALLGAAAAVAQPAEFALVPAVAGEARLSEANGYIETARYSGLIAGPLTGGALVAVGGAELALLIDAATFVFVAVAMLAIRARQPPVADPAAPGDRERASEGFSLLLSDRVLALPVLVATAALVFMSISIPADVFFVHDVLDAGDLGYGILATAWGVGMVAGAVGLARRIPHASLVPGALVAIVIQGSGKPIAAVVAVMAVAVAGYVIGGVGMGVRNVVMRTLIHLRAPERLRGRAFAAYNAMRNTAELAALAAGGVLVQAVGPRTTLLIAGLGQVAAGVAGLALARRLRGSAVTAAAPP